MLRVTALFAALTSGCLARSAVTSEVLAPGCRQLDGISYFEGEPEDADKHRLNLFVPAPGASPFSTVLFVHGGGWRAGDRNIPFDFYGKLGRRLARRGIGAAVISYRLAPAHRHPEQVQDVARAIAWTLANIADYGGAPSRVYAMGHSAGAQLVALAMTDRRWLAEVGTSPASLAGAICISGPYDVERLGRSMLLGGVPMVRPAFGSDPAVWRDASPGHHLKDSAPPRFLVVAADGDYPALRDEALRFAARLREARVEVTLREAPFEDHFSVVGNLGVEGNALGRWIEEFVAERR